MSNQIYFGPDDLRRGHFFELGAPLHSEAARTYELEEWIGRGGNAAVYRCRDSSTGDEHAIKFLLRNGERMQKRFDREIELLQRLRSSHSIGYLDRGRVSMRQVSGRSRTYHVQIPFIVMELARCNLQEIVREISAPLEYEVYAGQFRGLSKALAALHGVAIHRDIKPENILVSGDRWMLSDYGLCSFVEDNGEDLTGDTHNLGPKFWLSPEAHNRRLGRGDEITKASDVYQLAAVFWYVATGRHPSGIVTAADWSGPLGLYRLLERCLFHDSRCRPKDGAEFDAELETVLSP